MSAAVAERPVAEQSEQPEESEQAESSARYRRVAETLRELRQRANLTQEALARRVDLTLSGYRGYEQGRRNLKTEQIERFADALGMPVSEITSRLWPDDRRLVETRYSAEWEQLQREVEGLPPATRERVLRHFRLALDLWRDEDKAREN